MDNARLFLFMAMAFVSMLLWQAWQEDYGVATQPTAAVGTATIPGSVSAVGDTPDAPAQASIDSVSTMVDRPAATVSGTTAASRIVSIKTDTLDLKIDTRGATVVNAKLVKHPVSGDTPEIKFELMSQRLSDFFIAQTGLLGGDATRTPNHEAIFTAASDSYELTEGDDQLSVDFFWQSEDGLRVTKRMVFTRNSHAIALSHIIENGSSSEWTGREYRQLQRGEPSDSGNAMMYTYTGGAIYSQEDLYQKYDFDELGSGQLDRDVTDGWIAMIQHYFLGAFVPPRGEAEHFYGKRLANGRAVIGTYTPAATVQPGTSKTFDGNLFLGPKAQKELAALAQGLELTVDYGFLSVLAVPMYWVLAKIQEFVGNWGWTIIIFTILIKLLFFKLSETSYRSMANMRKMSPRIQALKDRYGDDKQRMQQAMMEMYKTEKINPLGGCLPMLVQMPFFIALYWVLIENVEMRQTPWILWIQDLSIKDPYFVLPLIMGVSMFIQQKLNPAPPDPMQAKIMMALPVVFTVMFAFFPAGLVLYWVVNNILSIAQQWVITKRIEDAA